MKIVLQYSLTDCYRLILQDLEARGYQVAQGKQPEISDEVRDTCGQILLNDDCDWIQVQVEQIPLSTLLQSQLAEKTPEDLVELTSATVPPAPAKKTSSAAERLAYARQQKAELKRQRQAELEQGTTAEPEPAPPAPARQLPEPTDCEKKPGGQHDWKVYPLAVEGLNHHHRRQMCRNCGKYEDLNCSICETPTEAPVEAPAKATDPTGPAPAAAIEIKLEQREVVAASAAPFRIF